MCTIETGLIYIIRKCVYVKGKMKYVQPKPQFYMNFNLRVLCHTNRVNEPFVIS